MAQLTRRQATAGLSGLVAGPFVARAAWAEAYPAGLTIKIVVPYPAGGATDIVGRIVGDRLGALWGVTTVVENVPGAGANIGIDRVAKGPADGTQILIVPPNLTTNPFLYAKVPYDGEKDILTLAQVASVPNLLVVKKDLPVNSVAELIAYAKANPGKLNFASSGVGSTIHLSGELFKRMTGIEMVHVAYRGSASAVNDLLGGSVDLMFDNISSIIGHARAGSVKALGITTAKRSSIAPEYVPVAETVPGYDTTSWFGVGVRAGTPPEIADKIETDVRQLCREKIVQERLGGLVADTIGSSRQEFTAYVKSERERWGKLIVDLKLRTE